MFDEATYDHELDTRGLNCPLPILKTKKALVGVEPGESLHVVATDPGSMPDFQAFAEQTGHELKSAWGHGDAFHFIFIKVAAKS